MKEIEKAIDYVRKNKSWSDEEEQAALDMINNLRCDIDFASPEIADEIYDLLEEYSDNEDLPEGWWMEYGTVDDIFFQL